MMLGLLGGAISGKLEHRPHRVAIRTPPVTQAPATTSTTLSAQEAAAVQTVKTSLVEDMTLDIRAQRLDPDVHRRLALATSAAGVARRHTDIALAWAPDKVAAVTARYDQLVRENATNASSPSVTDGAFVVTLWHDVSVTGTSARVTCRGHYRLLEPTNPQAVLGAVEQPDTEWTVTMTETTGRWRLEDRSTIP